MGRRFERTAAVLLWEIALRGTLRICNRNRETSSAAAGYLQKKKMTETSKAERNGWVDNKENLIMTRIVALLMGATVTLGTLAIASGADAQVKRYRGPQGYYDYYSGPPQRYYESPTYAPDRPAPRNYNNLGIPDFQNRSRG